MARVSVIMGSDSDLPVMQSAVDVLNSMEIDSEVTIVSAHRTPRRMVEYAESAADRGIHVIIAGAGGAAHLPGMVAALTRLPVIGVPVQGRRLDGLDSLLSIVQMPRGVPVATVAINNATNAALLAARILGITDPQVADRVQEYSDSAEAEVVKKAKDLENLGAAAYLGKLKKR